MPAPPTPPKPSSRSKRDAILDAAVQAFGRDGYEDSKWADVAKAVGIGSTALYHYFESKLHCLYVIMADTLHSRLEEFESDTRGVTDYPVALEKVLRAGFDLTEHEVLCHRVLIASRRCWPCTARRSGRRRRASALAPARATWSSRGRRSSRGRWNRARSRRPTLACSRAPSSASTT